MKNRKISKRKITAVIALLLCGIMLFGQAYSVWAAEAKRSTSKNPVKPIMTDNGSNGGVFVGRYQFNYTGNKNYYQYLQTGATVKGVVNTISGSRKTAAKNALGQTITNSSSAKLKKNGGNGNIKAAYLVWQTRSPQGAKNKIALVDPNGKATAVSAKEAVVDYRVCTVGDGWENESLYNMYADVTKIVTGSKDGGKGKYGTYSVCNIPIWDMSGATEGTLGESMATWELIVLEEGNSFPIRACTMRMTSTFSLDTKLNAKELTIDLPLGANLSTRADDGKAVSGQVFFGCSTSHNNVEVTKTFSMKDGKGKSTGSMSISDKKLQSVGDSCVRMELVDFSKKSFYNSKSASYSIKTDAWTSFFLLGLAVDVAQPTFSGAQTTTINPDGTVNVSATGGNVIKNTTNAKQGDTGYYDATLTVTLDNALEPVDTSNIKLSYYNKANNRTYTVTGSYSNHVVTFAFPSGNANYFNYTNGSYLSYDIQCKVVDNNAAQFNNSHILGGNLYSRGAKTGVWIDKLNTATSSAERQNVYRVHYDGNGGDASEISDQVCIRDVYYNITEQIPTRDGYTFMGWGQTPNQTYVSYYPPSWNRGNSQYINLANVDETKILYAIWAEDTYVVHFEGNGATGGSMQDMKCMRDTDYNLTANAFSKTGYSFNGWNTKADGSGIPFEDKASFRNLGNITLYAQWKIKFYKVTLHAGNGIETVTGDGTYAYNSVVTVSASIKEGYHWLNWTGNFGNAAENVLTTDTQTFVFQMPEHNVDMTANGEANQYTICFDPNGGTGHIDDIQTTYDTDVTLPDATDVYKKYTLDGVNVTDDVVSGIIPEDLIIRSAGAEETGTEEFIAETPETAEAEGETRTSKEVDEIAKTGEALEGRMEAPDSTEALENGTEQTVVENSDTEAGEAAEDVAEGQETTEDTENEEMSEDGDDEDDELETEEDTKAAHSLKKAYLSVFLGWALYDDKDKLTPTWKAGDVVRNLTAENNGTVTLYAVWDDCPWITATDLYYTLEQAQSGYITVDEILSHASAVDREDGSPILPGNNPVINNPAVNTSFTIPDYQECEFTNLTHDAAISENLTVVDSVGSTYQKQIMVYIVDTTPVAVKPRGVTRFISEKYFNAPYESGGLEDNSIWKTNSEYRAALQSAFDHFKNDTFEQVYTFTQDQILEIKEYVKENGIGNSKSPDALQEFYKRFMR